MSNLWGTLLLVITIVETIISAAKIAKLADKDLLPGSGGNASSNSSPAPDIRDYRTWPDDVQLGCRELRAKRFISDGFCTSIKPIREVVCAGHCLPIKERNLPWWSEFTKYWAKPKLKEWRCEEAVTKLKKVQLLCENGETRTYKIKIVKSCRCKNYARPPNWTDDIATRRKKQRRRRKERTRKERTRTRTHKKSRSKGKKAQRKQKVIVNSPTETHSSIE